ncbi:hypothetical protein ACIA58_14265 [Kribbella sp. NPDC051586]|uniref:hypothetical protein n=1 Tax=Kribbella sp. NPDC051586 TaxID=3364118 RepID=UPI0037AAA9E2
MSYRLVVHPELRQEVSRLHAAWKDDPSSDAGREFEAFREAMTALREGREGDYIGKQLSYGPSSHDLRDAAEIKVDVFNEGGTRDRPRPSHRIVYREFDPLPKVEDGRVVRDPNAQPVRQIVAFNHRRDDPAAIAGDRLGRIRGQQDRNLHGLVGGGRPQVGPQRPGAQTTPHRLPMPQDVLHQILRDSPAAGSAPKPASVPEANVNRPPGPGAAKSRDR